MASRRIFIKSVSGAAALSLLAPGLIRASTSAEFSAREAEDGEPFRLGIAGYTFAKFKLDPALEMMKKVDVHWLCIKDFHLPMKSNAEEIAAFHAKLKEAGVTGYGVGPIYMKTRAAIDDAFDYAKRVGVDLIVGIPETTDLPYVEQKVKEYNIRYAIHNHGPGDKVYPNAETVNGYIKDLDPRVGMCFDIGHDMRYGNDPIADFAKYHNRILDLHLKNVTSATHDGSTNELGRGVIDIPKMVKAIRKVNYKGVCALEYEKDMSDPLAGIAESVGYFRGVLDATRKG